MAALCCWKRKGVDKNNALASAAPRSFSYPELVQATSRFAEKLGAGGFGAVYKGVLENPKLQVAVKRLSEASDQGRKEFESEVNIISKLGHRNLVRLLGWCENKEDLLLVYEYMENGSLDLHLFRGKSLLAWGVRYNIATGLALALKYLHEDCENCVLHRDIKSSNIMLDSDFNTKLGDFGLARLVDHAKFVHTMTYNSGTPGYMAPEYVISKKASKKTDVYSFGVVALEIACGIKHCTDTGTPLIDWVWALYEKETLLEAADPLLKSDYEGEEVKRLMMVGLWCVHPKPDHRPMIPEVIAVLQKKDPVPKLPSRMPVSYNPPLYREQSLPSKMPINSDGQSSNSDYITAQSNLDSKPSVINDAPPPPLSTQPSLPSKMPVTYNAHPAPLFTGRTV